MGNCNAKSMVLRDKANSRAEIDAFPLSACNFEGMASKEKDQISSLAVKINVKTLGNSHGSVSFY